MLESSSRPMPAPINLTLKAVPIVPGESGQPRRSALRRAACLIAANKGSRIRGKLRARLGAALLMVGAGQHSPVAAAEIAIHQGVITSIAIAPGANGVAAVIDGGGGEANSPAEVRWWNWNGEDGNWAVPSYHVGALTWDNDRALLVGGMMDTRFPEVRWWRLGTGGVPLAECRGLPIGPNTARLYAMRRGVNSIAVLRDGKVVTGGIDATLAVWEGCTPTWLRAESCCYAEHEISVTAQGDGFITTGEGDWQNEELGYKDVGPRQWSPSPWKAAPIAPRAVTPGLHADGESCSVTVDLEGQLVVSGPRSWTAPLDKDTWSRLATSSDCTAVAVATERRLVWVKAP